MKICGILVAAMILLGGCNPSQDADFQSFVKELERDLGLFLLEKKKDGNEFFLPMESLKEDSTPIHAAELNKKLNPNLLFKEELLNEKNREIKKMIRLYATYKIEWEGSNVKDSLNFFSMIKVLKAEVGDESFSADEQFIKIIDRLNEMPNYFVEAKKRIINPSKEKLQQAISQYSEDYFYLKNELSLYVRKPDILKEDQIDFSEKNGKAQLALKDFIAFLNSQLYEKNSG